MLCIPNTDVVSVRVCVTYVWSSEGVHTRLCGHDNKLQNTFVSVVESEPALRPPPYRVEETLRHTGHFETMTSLLSTLLFVYMWNGATKHLWPVSDFEDVLVTVAFLLRRNPRAQFWTTYQERRSSTWTTTTTTTVPSLSVVSTDVSIAASGLTLLLLFLPMFQCRLVDRSSAPPVEAELRRRPAEHVWCRWSRAGRVESAGQPQRRHDDHHAEAWRWTRSVGSVWLSGYNMRCCWMFTEQRVLVLKTVTFHMLSYRIWIQYFQSRQPCVQKAS